MIKTWSDLSEQTWTDLSGQKWVDLSYLKDVDVNVKSVYVAYDWGDL